MHDNITPTTTLFVYGTLKRGQCNHERFCRNAIDIQPATTWGRLYQLPAGYPALAIPESAILAHGTVDPIADAVTQARFDNVPDIQCSHPGDWNLINGEAIVFADPTQSLLPIDRLEGFTPGDVSVYRRVLTRVDLNSTLRAAWVYTMRNCYGERIANGIWEYSV